jgi:hypothetical protein
VLQLLDKPTCCWKDFGPLMERLGLGPPPAARAIRLVWP